MISNRRYWFLLILMVLVYCAGMFVTLFENDSAQFAVMAMRMVQENDFLSLFKGPEAYLDKPHMHYWLAAISFKIFGIYDWAYRIPGILATLLGAYSCFGLGKLLYNKEVGKLAALVFMTAQTIVLSAIDLRTDAVLTGFTILSIWQLAAYIKTKNLKNILIGAFATGIAFSTKGQIAILVIGLPLLCHLAYSKKWKTLLHWKVLAALVIFSITIAPMLFAYYHQFDLHPEQIIRGRGERSGILFIFWEQSFERMSGEGIGTNSSDYFFFFHTFLWVFIPWSVLGILAYGTRAHTFIKEKLRYNPVREFLTFGGITLIFIVISFAQFKLPHYLNITIPLFAILTASYLYNLSLDKTHKYLKRVLGVQYFILAIVFIASCLMCFYVFKFRSPYAYFAMIVASIIIVYYCLIREDYSPRIITISVCSSLLLNAVLNLHFYPHLLNYQAGSSMSKRIVENDIPVDEIYKISENYTWALDFYNKAPVKTITIEGLMKKDDVWVYASKKDLEALHAAGFDWDRQFTENQFRITRLQRKFLDPATRKKVLNKMHLVHVY